MRKHPPARGPLSAWLAEAETAAWKTPQDVKERYGKLSVVAQHYVFDMGGNKYRLDCMINFDSEIVLVNRVGTHDEYDSWTF